MESVVLSCGQGLGDLVMATPVMQALATLYGPVSVVATLNSKEGHKLLEGMPFVKEVFTSDPKRDFDICVRTAWGKHVRSKRTVSPVGCGMDKPKEAFKTWHEIEYNMIPARKLGFTDATPMPRIGAANVSSFNLPNRYMVFAPGWGGASPDFWVRKGWNDWFTLHRMLRFSTVLLGSGRWGKIALGSTHIMDLWDKTTVLEVAGILKGADVVVAVDNGVAHMAAALGVPTVVLFGPTRTNKNKPYGPKVQVVSAQLDCSPCQLTDNWKPCTKFECMSSISPQTVAEYALNYFGAY